MGARYEKARSQRLRRALCETEQRSVQFLFAADSRRIISACRPFGQILPPAPERASLWLVAEDHLRRACIMDASNNGHASRRGVMGGAGLAAAAVASASLAQTQTDTEAPQLDGQPVPEPGPDKSAGPVRPGRGSMLT